MKIEDARKDQKGIFFHKLSVGDTFEYDEGLWLKIGEEEAFNLNDEWDSYFDEDVLVTRVKVKITIID